MIELNYVCFTNTRDYYSETFFRENSIAYIPAKEVQLKLK